MLKTFLSGHVEVKVPNASVMVPMHRPRGMGSPAIPLGVATAVPLLLLRQSAVLRQRNDSSHGQQFVVVVADDLSAHLGMSAAPATHHLQSSCATNQPSAASLDLN